MIKTIDAKLETKKASWGEHGGGSSSLTTTGETNVQIRICVGQVIISFDDGETFLPAQEIVDLIKATGWVESDS